MLLLNLQNLDPAWLKQYITVLKGVVSLGNLCMLWEGLMSNVNTIVYHENCCQYILIYDEL